MRNVKIKLVESHSNYTIYSLDTHLANGGDPEKSPDILIFNFFKVGK